MHLSEFNFGDMSSHTTITPIYMLQIIANDLYSIMGCCFSLPVYSQNRITPHNYITIYWELIPHTPGMRHHPFWHTLTISLKQKNHLAVRFTGYTFSLNKQRRLYTHTTLSRRPTGELARHRASIDMLFLG